MQNASARPPPLDLVVQQSLSTPPRPPMAVTATVLPLEPRASAEQLCSNYHDKVSKRSEKHRTLYEELTTTGGGTSGGGTSVNGMKTSPAEGCGMTAAAVLADMCLVFLREYVDGQRWRHAWYVVELATSQNRQ